MDKSEYIDILKKDEEIKNIIKNQNDIYYVFLASVFTLIFSNFVQRSLFTFLKDVNPYSPEFSWIYLIIIIIPALLVVKVRNKKIAHFGAHIRNLKNAIRDGFFLGVLVVLFFVGFIFFKSNYLGLDFKYLINMDRLNIFHFLLYIANVSLQQLLRSIFYISFCDIFQSKKNMASIITAAIFGSLHIQFGFGAVALTFIAALAFNALQKKHGTLAGVILFHSIVGWAAYTIRLL